MAFYTSRVDEFGNEIERRPTVPVFASSTPSASDQSLSDSMSELSLSSRSSFGSATLFRHIVNTAAYIEKEVIVSDSASELDNVAAVKVSSQPLPIKNVTFRKCGPSRVESEIKLLPKLSPSKSTGRKRLTAIMPTVAEEGLSGTEDAHPNTNVDMLPYDQQLAEDFPGMFAPETPVIGTAPSCTQLQPVPSLDLQSEPDCQSSTGSFFYGANQGKLLREPDQAYKNWLSAKRRLINDKVAQKKSEQELKQRQQDERKKKAQENYELWLKSKAAQSRETSKSKPQTPNPKHTKSRNYDEEKRSDVLQKWEKQKREEDAKRRAAKREEQKSALKLEQDRRTMAEKAWVEWKADAASKPKPVPLGQGFSSLRGTVSDIFVNPNKWVKDIPSDDD